MEKYSATIVALTSLSFAALIVVLVFNGIVSSPNNGVFNNTVGNISDKYPSDLTPAGYTFSIWAVIYIWQCAWTVYALSCIFRKNSQGPVLLHPVVLTVKFHIFWIASCVFNVTWLFVWDSEHLLVSFIVLLAYTLCGHAAVAFHGIAVHENEERLRKSAKADLICNYVLVQNGTDLMYSWTTVATLLNLSITLSYEPLLPENMSRSASGTLSLCILAVLIIGWSVAENTIFFKYFRFVYSWYGVLIWASAGILVKNFDPSNVNTILTIVVLCIAVVCLSIKIGVYFCKTRVQKKA